MPFITTKTTEAISADKKAILTRELSRITSECLGKGENWIMTGFEDQASLSFQGSDAGIAYVEVKTFGTPADAACRQMTSQVCSLLERELSISPSRVYVAYFPTGCWGWNGNNF